MNDFFFFFFFQNGNKTLKCRVGRVSGNTSNKNNNITTTLSTFDVLTILFCII